VIGGAGGAGEGENFSLTVLLTTNRSILVGFFFEQIHFATDKF
jgi:hypothetical protein